MGQLGMAEIYQLVDALEDRKKIEEYWRGEDTEELSIRPMLCGSR